MKFYRNADTNVSPRFPNMTQKTVRCTLRNHYVFTCSRETICVNHYVFVKLYVYNHQVNKDVTNIDVRNICNIFIQLMMANMHESKVVKYIVFIYSSIIWYTLHKIWGINTQACHSYNLFILYSYFEKTFRKPSFAGSNPKIVVHNEQFVNKKLSKTIF